MDAEQPDFRMLFESAPAMYLVVSPELNIVAASDIFLAATMSVREEILGRYVFDAFPENPGDPSGTGPRTVRESMERVVAERKGDVMPVLKYDVPRPEAEGGGFEVRYWSAVHTPLFDAQGELVAVIQRADDVTDFMHLQHPDAPHEGEGRTISSRGEQIESEILQRAYDTQKINERLREYQLELERRVQERTADLAAANQALRDEMLQSRKLEEQFRQMQKMEAVGTLAAGVAHDFNNLLTIISGYAELLLDEFSSDSVPRRAVEQIREAGDRAASLTRQLLAFSRQQVLAPQVLDLNSVVSGIERMLRRMIGEDVLLTTVLAADPGCVLADPGQLDQVLMNLAVNARDAMPQGGKLTLETAAVTLDKTYASTHAEVTPGEYVMVAVSDDGCGIDAPTQARVFEPFFTTKPHGQGTGLGLATVFGIVKQSGGHIGLYSEVGRGTTFKVYLPKVRGEVGEERAVVTSPTPTGKETLLIVEDEDAVRTFMDQTLRMLGYTVLVAPSGDEALRLCESHPGPIHLLISDVIMPEMGGQAVAEGVRALRPDVQVMFSSGYTNDAIVRHGILEHEVAFLPKPFTPSTLARKVREVLGQPEEG